MTKSNIKQGELLKKTQRASKKPQSNFARSMMDFKNAQDRVTVHYTDLKGKDQTKSMVLRDPGVRKRTEFTNLLQTSSVTTDWIGIYDLLMKHVIVNPSLSFASEDTKLPKSLKRKDVTVKNKNGVTVTLHFVFPGHREAVQIVNETFTPIGGVNAIGTLDDLEKYVFRTDNNTPVKDSYFDMGGEAFGLGDKAISLALHYLAVAISYDGFRAMAHKAFSFLSPAVQR